MIHERCGQLASAAWSYDPVGLLLRPVAIGL
jgi:hypothetical protein